LFDIYVDAAINNIVNMDVSGLTRVLWSLPVSKSGMGIPVSEFQAHGAFAASVFGSWEIQSSLGVTTPRPGALNAYSLASGEVLDDNVLYTSLQLSQHDFKVKGDTLSLEILISQNDTRLQALIKSKSIEYSWSWLIALPSSWNGQNISPTIFRSLLKFHSGMPFKDTPIDCPETKCKATMDIYGDHAISCKATGECIGKHNKLVQKIAGFARRGRINLLIEERVERDRLGDLMFVDWTRNQDKYFDLSVVSSTCPSYRNAAAANVGGAIKIRVVRKMERYRARIEESNLLFLPLVVESLGGWDVDAIKLLKEVAARVAEEESSNKCIVMKGMMTQLSVCLQKMNGAMIKNRVFDY
jgi:hypothetical protein